MAGLSVLRRLPDSVDGAGHNVENVYEGFWIVMYQPK